MVVMGMREGEGENSGIKGIGNNFKNESSKRKSRKMCKIFSYFI